MAAETMVVRVRVAWWLRLYLLNVAAVARLTGMEPDMGKVGRMIDRGVRVVR